MAQAFEFPNRLKQFREKYHVSDDDMEALSKAGPIVQSVATETGDE